MVTNQTIKAVISGRVQGVFFRAETKKAADRLNVKGYVKNLSNGCVEAVFQADEDTLEKMIHWCYQGSPGSAVSAVDTVPWPEPEVFSAFDIRY